MANKTPAYTRAAVDRYRAKIDILHVRVPKGCRERLAAVGLPPAACADLIMTELERREGGLSSSDRNI